MRVLAPAGALLVALSLTGIVHADGTFTATASLPEARYSHSATKLCDGRVLVAGGGTTTGIGVTDSAVIYNPATGTWSATGTMTQVRTEHTATLLPNCKVLVTGGGLGTPGRQSAEIYDPATGA